MDSIRTRLRALSTGVLGDTFNIAPVPNEKGSYWNLSELVYRVSVMTNTKDKILSPVVVHYGWNESLLSSLVANKYTFSVYSNLCFGPTNEAARPCFKFQNTFYVPRDSIVPNAPRDRNDQLITINEYGLPPNSDATELTHNMFQQMKVKLLILGVMDILIMNYVI